MDSDIRGKWLNINNGEIINVINSVIDENNNMIIISDIGHLQFNDFSSNYVKCDDDVNNDINNQAINIDDDMLIDDIPYDNSQQLYDHNINDVSNDKSNALIDNIFEKIESKPNIIIDIEWDDFPANDIKTLIKYLNIDINDISKYISDHYVNDVNISNKISELIKEKIN